MLRAVHSITGLPINALDGKIGSLKSLHFDDRTWKVRYLVAKLGSLLDTKDVLILTAETNELSWVDQCIKVDLSKEQVKNALPFGKDLPVSYQKAWIKQKNFETLYMVDPWNGNILPMWFPDTNSIDLLLDDMVSTNLRTTEVVDDYKVVCNEDKKVIAEVKDFILDDDDWTIRYLVIDTNGIYTDGDVLVSTYHVEGFSSDDKEILIDLDKEQLKDCPKYKPHELVNRDYVLEYYDYEGKLVKRSKEGVKELEELDSKLGLGFSG